MSRIIVITSGKGGVGKTTSTANLGIALAKRGCKLALIDADFGMNYFLPSFFLLPASPVLLSVFLDI